MVFAQVFFRRKSFLESLHKVLIAEPHHRFDEANKAQANSLVQYDCGPQYCNQCIGIFTSTRWLTHGCFEQWPIGGHLQLVTIMLAIARM